ncbi:hypothetical protein GQ43DRAFT_437584 [Delitschia confertaspora ATCC 74209]|uniref:Uncharacterized protein n=1 Tax=Delitschia confertaspora ATCC 74209 TaxID=1513339 RepID=A0A9P4N2H7_9PLEO|nr:hypothetical protein GQ43DRAFT_437584 [Delitschia confertaspora ATCC 74209]
MGWVYDEFAQYRLREDVLEKYLTESFGNYEFYIKPINGTYKFWIPQKLSDEQRRAILRLRF